VVFCFLRGRQKYFGIFRNIVFQLASTSFHNSADKTQNFKALKLKFDKFGIITNYQIFWHLKKNDDVSLHGLHYIYSNSRKFKIILQLFFDKTETKLNVMKQHVQTCDITEVFVQYL
jgi:hypothetical protein